MPYECVSVCVRERWFIVQILHNFQHFTQNFVAANLRKFMQLKVFSRIGLDVRVGGAQLGRGACVSPMSRLIGSTLIFQHTHTHTHINCIFCVCVRQSETFYATAPQLFFGIKYLSCKWRVREREREKEKQEKSGK